MVGISTRRLAEELDVCISILQSFPPFLNPKDASLVSGEAPIGLYYVFPYGSAQRSISWPQTCEGLFQYLYYSYSSLYGMYQRT